MACKEGQFDVVELMVNDQFKTFVSIKLNAQHMNGITPFDLAVHNGKLDFIWLAKKDNLMLLN